MLAKMMNLKDKMLSGELEVELVPQGTLATRCMMAGYGIPFFPTPAGVGTEVAIGKEVRSITFRGETKDYLIENAFESDFAIVTPSVTANEIFYLDLPMIAIKTAKNQNQMGHLI